ncbi:hypothetical protein [Nocardia sp. NPDC051570]|uniref:hypothetical protein n=1 Tax=Nocardia sp. NPDC051570 TaxID=3364324 RepID=UPI00378D05D7
MRDIRHNRSCGRRLARNVLAAGGCRDDAVFAVHRHCDVSLLRAHRIVNGHTLTEAVELLREILRSRGMPSEGLAHQQLSRWETGRDVPTPHYRDALCVLYRTRPDRLGLGHDYSDMSAALYSAETVERSEFPHPENGAGSDVDVLEELTEQAGYLVYTVAPAEFIPARLTDIARIQAQLLVARSPSVRRRLYRVFAKNAGFIGNRIIDVAGLDDSLEWLGIARRASRLAGDASVEAWIAGHICTACAWYSRAFSSSLAAAHMAQSVGGGRPNAAAVFGHLAEAWIHARMDCPRETLAAIGQADRMFATLPETERVADGCHIVEYFLRWHQSGALTAIGARADAEALRARALELPSSHLDPVGRAVLHLDAAASKIEERELEWGCRIITEVWARTPPEYRVGQIPRRAWQILDSISPAEATRSEVRDVRDLLETAGGWK